MTVTRSTNGPACLALPAFVPWRDRMSPTDERHTKILRSSILRIEIFFAVLAMLCIASLAYVFFHPVKSVQKKDACSCEGSR